MRKYLKIFNEFLSNCVSKTGHTLDEDNLKYCMTSIEDVLRGQFKGRKPSISPSNSMVAPRKMWFTLNKNNKTHGDEFNTNTLLKMGGASILEYYVLFLMKEAGIPIEGQQRKIKYDLLDKDGNKVYTVKGSMDFILDGKVYDFKCTNKEAYSTKFRSETALMECGDFAVGYIPQGELYGKGISLPFGGWLVLCLDDFKMKLVKYEKAKVFADEAINVLTQNISVVEPLASPNNLEACFPTETTKEGAPKIAWQCSKCVFRDDCWGDSITEENTPWGTKRHLIKQGN